MDTNSSTSFNPIQYIEPNRLHEAVEAVELLLKEGRSRYPNGLPSYHPARLSAWREGKVSLPEDNRFKFSFSSQLTDPLQAELEIHRAHAEAVLVHEQLRQTSLEPTQREQLIQRSLGILPASEAQRFIEIHSCPATLPRNIAESTEKLLNAFQLIAQSFGEASAFAYILFIVAGLRARAEFENCGRKLDTLFEKITGGPSVVESLNAVMPTGRPAGFEPQFRLLIAVRERVWALKPSRLAPTGFLLTKVIDAYLSSRPGAGNVLGLAVLDGIIIGKLGYEVHYIFNSGSICLEITIDSRSVYWDPTKPSPLSFDPILTGKRLNYSDLIGLTYASIANSYFSQTYWDRAIENFQRVLELIPGSTETYADLALCYLRKNQPELAIKTIEKGLQIASDSPALHHLLGNAYALANQWRQAIFAYKKAVQLAPKFPEAWYNMGLAYEKLSAWGQAEAAFKMALELKPDYCTVHLALGNLYLEQQKTAEAIRCYREALKHDSNLVAAYYNLGRAYYERKELDNAINAYQKAIKLNPKHAGAWHNLGIVYRDKGMKEKAVEALEKAVALNPNLLR